MRLIYEKSREPVMVGDKVTIGPPESRYRVTVNSYVEPHKPASSGKVVVMYDDGSRAEYYVGIIGAEWIEREDRGEGPALMRNGKPLKAVPDGSPRRMADGKNAWRKMNEAQRREFINWMANAPDAPATDVISGRGVK